MSDVLLILIVACLTMSVTIAVMYSYHAHEMKQYILLEIDKLPPKQVQDWRMGKCKVSIRFTYPAFRKRHLSVVKEENTNDQEN